MENLAVIAILIMLGYAVGKRLEARHYRFIRKRERATGRLPVIVDGEYVKETFVTDTRLVYGSVVVSIDYFKRMMAGLLILVGGSVSSYESLIDRARREAVLRMKEMAEGASVIVNVRLETSSISRNTRKGNIGSVEVFAYGTALKLPVPGKDGAGGPAV